MSTVLRTRRPRWREVIAFYLGLALVIALWAGNWWLQRQTPAWRNLNADGHLVEPSGVVYLPERKTLLAVGDEGQLVEFALDGRILRSAVLGGDLEGITLGPGKDTLLVLDERGCRFLAVSATTLTVQAVVDLSPLLREAGLTTGDPNTGLEGIAWQPQSSLVPQAGLWLAHQRDPALLLHCNYDFPSGRITLRAPVAAPLEDVSDLSVDPDSGLLLVASRSERVAVSLGYNNLVIERRALPGTAPEGIAILPDRTVVIADDSGGIWVEGGPSGGE